MSVKCKRKYDYKINDETLETVDEINYLGVIISNTLSCSKHIASVTKKSRSMLGFIQQNLKNAPKVCKQNAYIAMVRSKLEYASTAWSPHLQKEIDMLERVKNRAVRFIQNDFKSKESGCVTHMKENPKD